MPLKLTTKPTDSTTVVCSLDECKSKVAPDKAAWYNIGITHYSKSKGQSYIQVHDEPFCCGGDHARQAAHDRADLHASLTHGVFDSAKLNPAQLHSDDLIRQNAEYSPLARGWASLPKTDCIDGKALGDEVYVPHVDYWNHAGGVHLGGYFQYTGGEVGCRSLENAIKAIHAILDEVFPAVEDARKSVASVAEVAA